MRTETDESVECKRKPLWVTLFCILCIILNIFGAKLGAWLADSLHIPVFLDCLGTILAAAVCGYIPGIAVGYLTNLINSFADSVNAYYAVLNAIIAVLTAFLYRKGWFRKPVKLILLVIILALVGGGLGSILTWFLFGGGFGEGISAPLARRIYDSGALSPFLSQFFADLIVDLLDKVCIILLSLLSLRLLPARMRDGLELCAWQQTPLRRDELKAAEKNNSRVASLRSKIVILISAALIIIAAVTTSISFVLFHRFNTRQESEIGSSIAEITAGFINPVLLDASAERGEAEEAFRETEALLRSTMDSHPDIRRICVFRIPDDRCEILFDVKSGHFSDNESGVFNDDDLRHIRDMILLKSDGSPSGVQIVNNETGRYVIAYRQVYDDSGRCVCYTETELSLAAPFSAEMSLLTKSTSLFGGFFILILALTLWLAEFSIVLPVNSMAITTSRFALSSEEARGEGVQAIRRLGIHTGDEIENLYRAIQKTSEDMAGYVADVQQKNATINRMQNSLITVLADMVESRDHYTGDHVKKTADYAKIILEELRKEHLFEDVLTDEFVEDVIHSAPLHDVGKIQVSDTLLNKPGRLTDDEFRQMQQHTKAGGEILTRAVDAVSGKEYLSEAENLAKYHHEKWDGTGYPYGIRGEAIPLSARIMAVADVFDALVSKRSYKDGFSLDKAFDIIREGIGTHFDPRVANAFLHAEAEVRKAAAQHGSGSEEDRKQP